MTTVTRTNQLSKHVQGVWPSLGDTVDEAWVDYFVDVLPPVFMSGSRIQLGEPAGPGGAGRWETLQRSGSEWIYTGKLAHGHAASLIGYEA